MGLHNIEDRLACLDLLYPSLSRVLPPLKVALYL